MLTVRFIVIDGIVVVRINCCFASCGKNDTCRRARDEPVDLSAWNDCGQLAYWSELKRGREAEVREHRGRGRIGAK